MSERVLVVIPAYDEETTIAGVLEELREVAPQFDRVVVNDGSNDATGEVVESIGEHQLRLPSNLGYGRAVQTGLIWGLQEGYDVVISMDADGQHAPADAVAVAQQLLESGADLVIGARFGPDRPYVGPLERRIGIVGKEDLNGQLYNAGEF